MTESDDLPPQSPEPVEAEPQEWRHLWQSDSEAPPPRIDARALSRRWRLQLWLVTAVEAALLLALLLWTIDALRRRPTGAELVLWVNGWTLAAVVTIFALWNRRGLWRPLTETTPHFLAHWRERCRRGLRTVAFVRAVVAFEIAFLVTLLLATGRGRPSSFVLLASIAIGYQVWTMLFERSCRRQMTQIGELEQEMAAETVARDGDSLVLP